MTLKGGLISESLSLWVSNLCPVLGRYLASIFGEVCQIEKLSEIKLSLVGGSFEIIDLKKENQPINVNSRVFRSIVWNPLEAVRRLFAVASYQLAVISLSTKEGENCAYNTGGKCYAIGFSYANRDESRCLAVSECAAHSAADHTGGYQRAASAAKLRLVTEWTASPPCRLQIAKWQKGRQRFVLLFSL